MTFLIKAALPSFSVIFAYVIAGRESLTHYPRWDRPQQTEFSVGRKNKWEPLVDPGKVL